MIWGFGNIVKLSQNGGCKTESKKLLKNLKKVVDKSFEVWYYE